MGPLSSRTGVRMPITVIVTVLLASSGLLVTIGTVGTVPTASALPNPIPVLELSLTPTQQQAVVTPEQNGPVQFNGNASVEFLPIMTCTVTLSASCIWPAIISPTTMEFTESGRPQQFYVTVVVPPATSCLEIGQLIVSGTARVPGMPAATSTANAVVTVKQYCGLELCMDRNNATGGPGDTLEFHALLTNRGNGLSSFHIGAVNVIGPLNVTFPRQSIDLRGGETFNSTVTVRVAPDARAGTYGLVVEVRETDPATPLIMRTSTLQLDIGRHAAALRASTPVVQARAGSKVALHGQVVNLGDLPATFQVLAGLPSGGVEVAKGELTVGSPIVLGPIELMPGETREFSFEVSVPGAAGPGGQKVRLYLERVTTSPEPVTMDSLEYTVDVKASMSSYGDELTYAFVAILVVVAAIGLYRMRRYVSRFEPATSAPSYSKAEVAIEAPVVVVGKDAS